MKNTTAYIGIIGALGMAATDIILLGQPVSGSYYDMSSFGAIEHIAPQRAAIGAAGGLTCAFLICFGFWYLKDLFAPINAKYSSFLFISLSSMMFFGGAFHAAYYFVSAGNLPVKDHRFYLETLSWLGVPGFVAGAVLFYLLASDKRFPSWYKFCNPLVLSGLFLLTFMLIPAPLGGYLKPTFVNLGTACLLLISLRMAGR